ncbi:hypothetical protein scyTo_0016242, partial [Scyliorhinus torazame]|nr:hypothetical protein [Scyliorhinus torazame]
NCNMIEQSMVEAAVQECSQTCDETIEHVFNVIGAFEVPRYIYNSERKKFLPLAMTDRSASCLFGTARNKAELFCERYTIMQQGKFFLEDPTGTVQLDLSKAQFHSGLYTESCFVLTEGWYEDGIFHVNGFGFPPTESSSVTRAYYGNVNLFGGPSATSVKSSAKLKQLEEENEDAMFVFVSDVWLDQVEVLEKLHMMFSGYSSVPPTCFIFCGNFSSAPYGNNQIKSLTESLKALADIICEYPNIHKNCRFVFVPGPEDPGPSSILPRPPLADYITEEFSKRVPFSVFTTNPCRIQYCTQEIVIFREDLVNKMCRNCIRFPGSNLDIPNHGSFPRSGFCFKVYYPSNRTVEDSKLQNL